MAADHLDDAEKLASAARDVDPEQRDSFIDDSCAGDANLLAQVRSLLGDLERAGHLEDQDSSRAAGLASTVTARPSQTDPGTPVDRIGPYRILDSLGEGGMGSVYLAEQEEPVRRRVAIKLIRSGMDTREVVARFEAERQALAMMEHPGIAKVFDAGSTDDGRPYFVMEYVPGLPITEHCDRQQLRTAERLELFMRVCDAVQHAHQKGVIHRDLKPSNILVMGQDDGVVPKVIDFGVAKATHQRLTERTVFTELGMIIGTPEYMSPEQAENSTHDIDTRSDIYSLGVLLYELLVGAKPFEPKDLRRGGYAEIQRRIREEEPPKPSTRLSSLGDLSSPAAEKRRTNPMALARELRGDLDWITMKAIEKNPIRRYATASEFAADIRRHLADEPVQAGPPTLAYRLSKFTRKHRGAVLAATALFVALSAGFTTSTTLYFKSERARKDARDNLDLAEARYEEIVRLSDLKLLADYEEEERSLWPAYPHQIDRLRAWIDKATILSNRIDSHRETLETLRTDALDYDDAQQRHDRETHPSAIELVERREKALRQRERLTRAIEMKKSAKDIDRMQRDLEKQESRIEALREEITIRRTWRFADTPSQWQHDNLATLVSALEQFLHPDPHAGLLASVSERLAFAEEIGERSVLGSDAAAAWREAIADIEQLQVYKGLRLRPQMALYPLGKNAQSGLWEFWHMQSGERPDLDAQRGSMSCWETRDETGIVLVLLPPGTFWMGAQSKDPDGRNYDPKAEPREAPPHQVTLPAFFLSKYEMTQGQWSRLTGANPSTYGAGFKLRGNPKHTLVHPLEQVSWANCQRACAQLGLELPTEEQWEYAARGGTDTVWAMGTDVTSLRDAANVCDRSFRDSGYRSRVENCEPELVDGYVFHSPVGSYLPNRFGLHDIHGNVREWCQDWYHSYETGIADRRGRIARGGSYLEHPVDARAAQRGSHPPAGNHVIGLRPARVLDD